VVYQGFKAGQLCRLQPCAQAMCSGGPLCSSSLLIV
jgi:hypothetical protein